MRTNFMDVKAQKWGRIALKPYGEGCTCYDLSKGGWDHTSLLSAKRWAQDLGLCLCDQVHLTLKAPRKTIGKPRVLHSLSTRLHGKVCTPLPLPSRLIPGDDISEEEPLRSMTRSSSSTTSWPHGWPTELPEMMEMFYIFAIQYGSHQSHVGHLKCGWCTEEVIFLQLR